VNSLIQNVHINGVLRWNKKNKRLTLSIPFSEGTISNRLVVAAVVVAAISLVVAAVVVVVVLLLLLTIKKKNLHLHTSNDANQKKKKEHCYSADTTQ